MSIEKLLTHPDKVFWPEEGYTKLDLARFYEAVFPRLKPYVDDRMLSLERCPDGMKGTCFYQKQAPKGMPVGTKTKLIQHEKKEVNYVLGGSLETQIALVNFGCIPVHVWGSRAEESEKAGLDGVRSGSRLQRICGCGEGWDAGEEGAG